MLAAILALMAAAADPQVAAPGNTVSPVTVSPQTKQPPADVKLDMQGSDDDVDQLVAIWPGTAYHAGLGGRVTLRCLVDVHGLAEHCDVAYESPHRPGVRPRGPQAAPHVQAIPDTGARRAGRRGEEHPAHLHGAQHDL